MWHPSTCDCKCNMACKIDEYLDNKDFSSKTRLISKLILTLNISLVYGISYKTLNGTKPLRIRLIK